MPGWHDQTKEYVSAGKVQVVGLIQEQHPDRARLFMQWKEMGWPLLVDSLNLLGVSAVPITLFLDEAGVIRSVNPGPKDLQSFLDEAPVGGEGETWSAPRADELLALPNLNELERASQAFLWGGEKGVSQSIDTFQGIVQESPDHAEAHFRLGVAYRKRHDSERRLPNDFGQAVRQWGVALDLNPNQYIWRRRIQQYGPRLTKPYSFYDWVHEARADLVEAGKKPLSLTVEPGGAEFAHPAVNFEVAGQSSENPDPEGRIYRDLKDLVNIETVAVPAKVRKGEAVRVHVRLAPDEARLVHWNNEVEDLKMWIDAPTEWQLGQRLHRFEVPQEPVSRETRGVEFELQASEEAQSGKHRLKGYALYYICEDVGGQCLYRRQDFEVLIDVID